MRNVSYLNVFAIPKFIFFWCVLFLLTSQVSVQIENETFASAFKLDDIQSKELISPEYNEYNKQISSEFDNLSEQIDFNKDIIDYNEKSEEEKEEVPINVDDNSKQQNTINKEIISYGLTTKTDPASKYVRYGKYFDINRRDHY